MAGVIHIYSYQNKRFLHIMKRNLTLIATVLLLQFSFAGPSAADADNDLKNLSAEAISCINGFATASQILGKIQYKGPNNSVALSLVKNVCTSDDFVIAFYNAQRNSKEAKSLKEIEATVQDMIGGWFSETVEILQRAERKVTQ